MLTLSRFIDDECEEDEAGERRVELLELCEDAPEALEPPEQALDFVAPLVHSRSYCQGRSRILSGGTAGRYPRSSASGRVALSWQARSMTGAGLSSRRPSRFSSPRPSGASCACPGESEKATAARASAATI